MTKIPITHKFIFDIETPWHAYTKPIVVAVNIVHRQWFGIATCTDERYKQILEELKVSQYTFMDEPLDEEAPDPFWEKIRQLILRELKQSIKDRFVMIEEENNR